MFTVGERIRWRDPLDADYSYGTILKIHNSYATVIGSGYYIGVVINVKLRHMEKIEKGGKGFGSSKKFNKRSAP